MAGPRERPPGERLDSWGIPAEGGPAAPPPRLRRKARLRGRRTSRTRKARNIRPGQPGRPPVPIPAAVSGAGGSALAAPASFGGRPPLPIIVLGRDAAALGRAGRRRILGRSKPMSG
jgi:hypothetical protein